MTEDKTFRELDKGLLDGRFLDGNRVLPERQLAEALGIGRTKLRGMLEALKADGRLFVHHGQGTFVSPPPAVEIGNYSALSRQVSPQNLMEVRLNVEPALAALAAERATPKELKALRRQMEETLRIVDTKAYENADDVFHYRIAELAHNPMFMTIFKSIREVRRHARWTNERLRSHSLSRIEQLAVQHQEIVEAISNRDPERAAELMEQHLKTVVDAMQEKLL